MKRHWALIVAFVLVAGCLHKRRDVSPASQEDPLLRKVDGLSILTTGSVPSATVRGRIIADLANGRFDLDQLLDALVDDPRFAHKIAPRMLLRPVLSRSTYLAPDGYVLKTVRDKRSGTPIYYLRKPCDPSTVETVNPWWAPDKEVRVCPDSHRPKVLGDPSTDNACGGLALSPSSSDLCGCGPQLVFCTKDAAHQEKIRASAVDEVAMTAAYVVSKDRNVDDLFLMDETVRDRNAEATYRRWRAASGEAVSFADLASWPAKGQLANRFASARGQHAGILTTPQLLFTGDALRASFKYYYEVMWCADISSSKVDAEAILRLGTSDVRVGRGWEELARKPICSDCHARLDYGTQFFAGYPSAIQALHFRIDRQRTGNGPLFGKDHNDLLGTAPLTPRGFATLAVAQPQFLRCMARHVTDYVFRGQEVPADYDAVLEAFQAKRTVKAAMRAALARYWTDPEHRENNELARSSLKQLLDDHCLDCHDTNQSAERNFNVARVPRSTLLAMLDAVAFGAMPKSPAQMDDRTRRRFIEELTQALWPEDGARESIVRYFASGLRASPVYDIEPVFRRIRAITGRASKDDDWYLAESGLRGSMMRYAPGFTAFVGLEALRSCKGASRTGRDLEQCIDSSSSPENVILPVR